MLIRNLTFAMALPVDHGSERLSRRPGPLLPRRRVAPRLAAVLLLALSTCAILLAFATMARAADPVLAAVGDIACTPGDTNPNHACQQAATAKLAASQAPAAVAVLGDNQYESGLFTEFTGSGAYKETWGVFDPIVHPAPGNHEYHVSATANGYFSYFGDAALGPAGSQGPNGSYSYDLGSWHIVALNSNCSNTVCQDGPGGTTSSAQVSWLQSDLAAHPNRCTLAYWHHPLFSAGYVGNSPGVAPLWDALYAAHADVVLSGHDHMYERFAQQDSSQNPTPAGIREFVVGTGGESLFGLGTTPPPPKPELLDNKHFGVLFLTLHAASYDWNFVATDRTTVDSGSTACHAQPSTPPATTTTSASPPPTTSTTASPPATTSTPASPPPPATGPPPAPQRLTFLVKSIGSGTFPSLRRHGLGVNVYCSRGCDVLITVRIRRGRRLVTIARFRETESELPSPFTHLVLRGLWNSIRHLRVATLHLTFVAHDAAGHQVTIRRNSTQRRR